MSARLNLYCTGGKANVLGLVVITALLGYALAANTSTSIWLGIVVALGTALSCNGASILNQVIERDTDRLMARTRNRPVASGVIPPAEALGVGLLEAIGGVVLLAVFANLLSGFIALLTAFIYVCVYTPLKRLTWLNTVVGAVPGALPPLGGWAAVTGSLDLPAWLLFAIVFIWQHPHFFAIAWLYREDYEKAGLCMLPVIDQKGDRVVRHIIAWTAVLFAVSLLPLFLGWFGPLSGAIVGLTGIYFLNSALHFAGDKSNIAARQVIIRSVIYLPIVLSVYAIGMW